MEKSKTDTWIKLGKGLFEFGKAAANVVAVPSIYEKIFGHHIDTPYELSYFIDDFPLLSRKRFTFKSNYKQVLVGYMYSYVKAKPKAIIVFAHGFGGGGQRSYMNVINKLASMGFYVFAYDATGNDESDGVIGGFPQAVIDLQHAIKFVCNKHEFKNYPICLFGHSMGGYAVSTVLNFVSGIKAVVACSGFDKPSEIIKEQAAYFSGNADEIIPCIDGYEKFRFGKYAKASSITGFLKTDAKILVIHSVNDQVIPIKAGLSKYQKEFRNSNKISFIKLRSTGHGTVYYSKEGIEYASAYVSLCKRFSQQKNISENDRKEFVKQNLDRKKWSNLVDENLFEKIKNFYIKNI